MQVINQAALRLRDIRRAAVGEDLLHLAENLPIGELRTLIDAALGGRQTPPLTAILAATSVTGTPMYLQVVATPCAPNDPRAVITNLLLEVTDVTAREQERLALERQSIEAAESKEQADDEAAKQRQMEVHGWRSQVLELTRVNRDLRDANHDLSAANLELRYTQEELQVQAEELKASNEEVETLNEEAASLQ